MKINLLILSVIVIAMGLWTFFDHQKSSPNKILPPFENFEIQTLGGETISLYDYKGQITFVHFWATWCAPCITELPKLIKLAQSNPNEITVLAIAVADNTTKIEDFIDKINLTLPANFIIGLDNNKQISHNFFNTIKLPETYVMRKNMTLHTKIVGADEEWNAPAWQNKIDNLY